MKITLTGFVKVDRRLHQRWTFNHFVVAACSAKRQNPPHELLSKVGGSWGCVSALDCEGRTIWIADAHRGDGKRFVVHADKILRRDSALR